MYSKIVHLKSKPYPLVDNELNMYSKRFWFKINNRKNSRYK